MIYVTRHRGCRGFLRAARVHSHGGATKRQQCVAVLTAWRQRRQSKYKGSEYGRYERIAKAKHSPSVPSRPVSKHPTQYITPKPSHYPPSATQPRFHSPAEAGRSKSLRLAGHDSYTGAAMEPSILLKQDLGCLKTPFVLVRTPPTREFITLTYLTPPFLHYIRALI
ncbi:hypothetical protein E2C01_030269 [Portunus trituberculatus]|uniref:Uncharacterized protein n=1 Tax=Portunus trituberculatus TaxID=210409 RepID=A0A5B7ERM5_PORTR|nr:hypothetical protein [Portunus trituberculatus]